MQIDKGIPIPNLSHHFSLKYPWPEMEHGDSIFVEKYSAVMSARSWLLRHKPGWIAKSRKTSQGFRVWFHNPLHGK